VELVIVATLA